MEQNFTKTISRSMFLLSKILNSLAYIKRVLKGSKNLQKFLKNRQLNTILNSLVYVKGVLKGFKSYKK